MDKALQEVVDEGSLPLEIAERYLSIYLGEADWPTHIGQIWNKVKDPEKMKKIISHAVLVSTTERLDLSSPHSFLHKSLHFRQLHEQDWWKKFQDVVSEDIKINEYRAQAQSMGRIEPLEYQPYTRQAYNWIYTEAEKSGVLTDESKEKVVRLLKNLVYVYGGAVICSVFTNHMDKVAKLHTWRSGYFFEKLLFKIYTPEQVYKIKKQELAKTSQKLVKRVRV